MRDLYYKKGDGFLLVYSITDSSSIDDVRDRFQSLLTVRVWRDPPKLVPRFSFHLLDGTCSRKERGGKHLGLNDGSFGARVRSLPRTTLR